jgi:hypothetical protein
VDCDEEQRGTSPAMTVVFNEELERADKIDVYMKDIK